MGAGFTEGLLQKFLAKESVSLFTDQFRSPICVDIMTNVISGCIRKRIGGILHGGGPERLSRYDTGTKLLSAYGLSPELLQSSSFKSHPQAEFLHEDGSFDTTKLKSLFPEYANETIYEGFRRDAAARTI